MIEELERMFCDEKIEITFEGKYRSECFSDNLKDLVLKLL